MANTREPGAASHVVGLPNCRYYLGALVFGFVLINIPDIIGYVRINTM